MHECTTGIHRPNPTAKVQLASLRQGPASGAHSAPYISSEVEQLIEATAQLGAVGAPRALTWLGLRLGLGLGLG